MANIDNDWPELPYEAWTRSLKLEPRTVAEFSGEAMGMLHGADPSLLA